ncbi:MAG: type II secretion system protein GspG [Myxococcaceae bacterium]
MTNRRIRRRATRQRGMTLIEIVVVVAIISMITAATAVAVMAVRGKAQVDVARLELERLEDALDIYAVRHGRYPETLQTLVEARVVKRMPRDPWGNEFLYSLAGGEPVLTSYGRDGAPGGTGEDADLSNEGQ